MSEFVQEIEEAGFEAAVLESSVPVVLDFFSTECPPCEALAPKYEALAERFGGQVRFFKVFRQGNRALADRLDVHGSPTVLFFRGGQELGERMTGDIKRSELKRAVESLIN